MIGRRGSRKVEPSPDAGPPAAATPGPPGGSAAPVDPAKPAAGSAPTGKGRPTPKRSESQRSRRPIGPPPQTRKEALQRQRAEARERRERARQGLVRGDEKYLPPRDRGPARALVRDVVDARRNAGVLFLPLAFVVFVGNFIPSARVQVLLSAVFLSTFLLLCIDMALLGRAVVQQLRQRFPEGHADKTRSLVFYGLSRSTLIRRLRAPRPRVKVGGAPV